MRLSNILHEVYGKPLLITKDGFMSVHRVIQSKLANDISSTKFVEESNTDIFGEPLPVMEVDVDMKLATIPVVGIVGHRIGMLEKTCGVVDVRDIRQNVKVALENPFVETILFDVNSPGGTVTGVPELADYIAQATKIKKTIAFTDTLMASAAYFLMAGCSEIISTPSADVGSVGVYQALLDVSKLYDDLGVKVELFKDGEYKAMGIEGIPLTDKQRELLQSDVNKISLMFKEFVKQYRKVSDETLQGQTFMGFDAVDNGLIDGVIDTSEDLFIN